MPVINAESCSICGADINKGWGAAVNSAPFPSVIIVFDNRRDVRENTEEPKVPVPE